MKQIINTFLCAFLMLTTLIARPLAAKTEGIGYDVEIGTTYRGIDNWGVLEFGPREKEHCLHADFSGSFESPEKDF